MHEKYWVLTLKDTFKRRMHWILIVLGFTAQRRLTGTRNNCLCSSDWIQWDRCWSWSQGDRCQISPMRCSQYCSLNIIFQFIKNSKIVKIFNEIFKLPAVVAAGKQNSRIDSKAADLGGPSGPPFAAFAAVGVPFRCQQISPPNSMTPPNHKKISFQIS